MLACISLAMTGRSCHALELTAAYVDVAITRWQTFAGEPAVLDATGEPFASITNDVVLESVERNVIIDASYVQKQLAEIVKNEDLSRYIL